MTEEVSRGISSRARSCKTKRSTSRPLRVVHISNPTMVRASASEFRSVVQSLTGRKRSCPSTNQHEEMNMYSGNQCSPQVKVPKVGDGLQTSNDRKPSVCALIDDNATVSNSYSDKDDGGVRIFEELEDQPIQTPHYIPSQYQVFEILESIGDTAHFVLDKFCPSILFSEFECL